MDFSTIYFPKDSADNKNMEAILIIYRDAPLSVNRVLSFGDVLDAEAYADWVRYFNEIHGNTKCKMEIISWEK